MTKRLQQCLVAMGLAAVAASAAVAAEPAYIGVWEGGPASCATPFVFDAKRYTPPGGQPLQIDQTERDGANYLLSFADGYRVALFDVNRNSLTWHSPISGDTFELTRCR